MVAQALEGGAANFGDIDARIDREIRVYLVNNGGAVSAEGVVQVRVVGR